MDGLNAHTGQGALLWWCVNRLPLILADEYHPAARDEENRVELPAGHVLPPGIITDTPLCDLALVHTEHVVSKWSLPAYPGLGVASGAQVEKGKHIWKPC